jgi:hypothetical protein
MKTTVDLSFYMYDVPIFWALKMSYDWQFLAMHEIRHIPLLRTVKIYWNYCSCIDKLVHAL